MKVKILRPGAPGKTSLIAEALSDALRERGAEVADAYPALADPAAPLPQADVIVLKDKTPLGLAWGRKYHELGVPAVSPYPMSALCRDKLAVNRALAAAGLPVPACVEANEPRDVLPLLAEGPVILKPAGGSQGRGITVIEDARGLPGDFGGERMIAQRYFRPDGPDRKIYRIGGEVFCVERPWPPVSLEDKLGTLVELDAQVRRIAMDCGGVLGGDVYGVDVIEHDGRPWIVDVASFPGFKGVPGAGARLAEIVLREARAAARLREVIP